MSTVVKEMTLMYLCLIRAFVHLPIYKYSINFDSVNKERSDVTFFDGSHAL